MLLLKIWILELPKMILKKRFSHKIDDINNKKKVIVPADKTSNFYKREKEE
jgi:hypothetical protein